MMREMKNKRFKKTWEKNREHEEQDKNIPKKNMESGIWIKEEERKKKQMWKERKKILKK